MRLSFLVMCMHYDCVANLAPKCTQQGPDHTRTLPGKKNTWPNTESYGTLMLLVIALKSIRVHLVPGRSKMLIIIH